MSLICNGRKYAGRWSAAVAAAAVLLAAGLFVANAQAPQPPYALFQYSSLTGSGNTITATQNNNLERGVIITWARPPVAEVVESPLPQSIPRFRIRDAGSTGAPTRVAPWL